jgi:hypothetical protein
LTILPDPRVEMSAQDYAALFSTTHELAAAFDASSAALLACKSLRAQLAKLNPKAGSPLSEQVHSLDEHIGELMQSDDKSAGKAASAGRGLERLNGDVATLYGQINDVDAVPTAVQIEETARAKADWQTLEPRWRRLREVEVPQLNRKLAQARLAQLLPDSQPPRDLNFADED